MKMNTSVSVLQATVPYDLGNRTLDFSKPIQNSPWYFDLCMLLLGTVGNLLLCLAILVDKNLQIPPNYFLFSLSIADLLISLVVIPARFVFFEFEVVPSLFPLCLMYHMGDNYLTAASALHICSISLERYHSIKDPLAVNKMSKKKLLRRIMLVWAMSFLTIVPNITLASCSNFPQQGIYCPYMLRYFPHVNIILVTESLVIFVMVVVVLYCFIRTSLILNRLLKQQKGDNVPQLQRTVASKSGDGKSRALESEKKALRVIWIMAFAFVLTLAPYGVCNIFHIFTGYGVGRITRKAVAYLNYTNSVINPIVYTIFNKKFRNNFVNLLMLKCKSNNN